MRLFLMVSMFAVVVPLSSWAADTCTFGGLTEGCEYFSKNKDKPEIVLPEGKKFPNPMYQKPASQAQQAFMMQPVDPKKIEEMTERNLELQEAIIEDLGSEYDTKFLLAISSVMTGVSIDGGIKGMKSPLMLPWPPKRSQGRSSVKTVSWDEFQSGFLDQLPAEKRKTLLGRFEQMSKNMAEAYGGYGAGSGSGYSNGNAGLDKPSGPGQAPGSAAGSGVLAEQTQLKKNLTRADQLVKEGKELLLSEISQGKPYASLTGDQKALYDKINTIKYVPPTDPKTAGNPACSGLAVNAFYLPGEHTFTLCPGITGYPDSALMYVIAHEMGHAIDPCRCSNGFYHVKKEAVAKDKGENPEDKAWMIEFLENNPRFSADPAMLTAAIEKGWIEEEAAPVPWRRYPQNVTFSCLKKQIGLRTVTTEMLAFEIREKERAARSSSGAPVRSEKEIIQEIEARKDNPACRSTSNVYSEAGEAMADAWGAKVLGRYLEKNPPKSLEEKIGTVSVHLAFGELCQPTVNSARNTTAREHPYSRERVDGILFTDHRVRQALGCGSSPDSRCLKFMGTVKTPTDGTGAEVEAGTAKDGQK
ncbi:MAG: hypothetical protein KF789_01450 [Bdellovibrionaceae bacterium]|nr:hypothetical protein [Pseudobdellovibrionaceae bacterium]